MSSRMWAEPEWRVTPGLVAYPDALREMEARVQAVADGKARELAWLLEHPPVYTGGTSAVHEELLAPDRFPVFRTGRGGRFTYHGPGQRIGYLVLDLGLRGRDVRRFVHGLEAWLIAALARIGLEARAVPGRVGIWVEHPTHGEAKIGAIGVRVRRWVAFHGFSLNVDPVLEHFSGIIPCGLADFPVTSVADLGIDVGMGALDAALRGEWPDFLRNLADNAGNS